MNDIHELRIFSNMFDFGMNMIEVEGSAVDIVKKFEQKKLSGSPFIVYDTKNNLWAFDVASIDFITINNVLGIYSTEVDKE